MKRSKLFLVTLTAVVMAVPAFAATRNADLNVSADVVGNCTITTNPIAFGNYDPIGTEATTDLDNTGSVVVTCTRGAGVSIDLGLGDNASGAQRRMKNGVANFLNYELYKDNGRTSVWGTAANGLAIAPAPSIAARTYTVYGRVPAGQDIPAGAYTDKVVATINY